MLSLRMSVSLGRLGRSGFRFILTLGLPSSGGGISFAIRADLRNILRMRILEEISLPIPVPSLLLISVIHDVKSQRGIVSMAKRDMPCYNPVSGLNKEVIALQTWLADLLWGKHAPRQKQIVA